MPKRQTVKQAKPNWRIRSGRVVRPFIVLHEKVLIMALAVEMTINGTNSTIKA
jgi:hypothetical protein